jgi:inosine-uridine nucleoside N-ribohydrolase
LLCGFLLAVFAGDQASVLARQPPVRLIFDTDMGNDVDDVQALAMIHALQDRLECELIAVTITKDHSLAAPFVDAVNTLYGRGDIPIGVCHSSVTPDENKYLGLASEYTAGPRQFPHDLLSGTDAPDAVAVLRRALTDSPDGSLVVVQVGFSTNLADLLRSQGDGVSPLSGEELVRQKVRLLSLMAGAFTPIRRGEGKVDERYCEYNVIKDIPSAQYLAEHWPTAMVWSGFEIGIAAPYPHESVDLDYRHPGQKLVAEAYRRYCEPGHNRPTWDLTSVLYAVRPERSYFGLSSAGDVEVADDGATLFTESDNGRSRYLKLDRPAAIRVVATLEALASQPPLSAQK